jgi:hypothetical protein
MSLAKIEELLKEKRTLEKAIDSYTQILEMDYYDSKKTKWTLRTKTPTKSEWRLFQKQSSIYGGNAMTGKWIDVEPVVQEAFRKFISFQRDAAQTRLAEINTILEGVTFSDEA